MPMHGRWRRSCARGFSSTGRGVCATQPERIHHVLRRKHVYEGVGASIPISLTEGTNILFGWHSFALTHTHTQAYSDLSADHITLLSDGNGHLVAKVLL